MCTKRNLKRLEYYKLYLTEKTGNYFSIADLQKQTYFLHYEEINYQMLTFFLQANNIYDKR